MFGHFANLGKSRSRLLLAVLIQCILGFSLGGTVLAQSAEISLTSQQMLERGASRISDMRQGLGRLLRAQELARQQNDIVQLNVVNERILQSKQLIVVSEENLTRLQEAVARNNRQLAEQAYRTIEVAHSKVQDLEGEVSRAAIDPSPGELEVETVDPGGKVAPVDGLSKPVLAAPGDIKGRLLDVDGITPHANQDLKLIRLPDETVVAESISDQEGRYIFLDIPSGEYNLQIGKATIRLLAAEGLPAQPLNFVVPQFLISTAPGVAAVAPAALVSWTTAAWTGGTIVVVGGSVVGVAAATGNLDAIGLDDDEAIEPTIPTTPPAPPGSPS